MCKSLCCSKEGLNRGVWTAQEDIVLRDYIRINGQGKWGSLPKRAGLKRCGKSCRLRWLNYLRPDIKRGNISQDEEDLIIRLHKLLGNRWSLIAGRLPGRTDNEIKNYWNTNILKKLNNVEALNQKNNRGNSSLSPNNSTFPVIFPSKHNSNVVLTKPSRCTKVVLNPQINMDEVGPSSVNSLAQATPSDNDSSTKNQSGDFHDFDHEFLQSEFEVEDPRWNFATNFDAGEELWLSDLLKAGDLSGACDYSNGDLSFNLFG